MSQVADREKDEHPESVVHFHIIPGIGSSAERKEWLCYKVFPEFVERLNRKYHVGADPKEFSQRHYAAGWQPDIMADNWVLDNTTYGTINMALRTMKIDNKGVLKVVLGAVPVGENGESVMKSMFGLKCVGDELYAALKEKFQDADVLYKDITFGEEKL